MTSDASQKVILAFVGMPGAGKSEATTFLEQKGIPFVRFGDVTDEGLKQQELPLTAENERTFRENLRAKLGMAAYAIQSQPKIEQCLQQNPVIILDGLYSWEEYIYLKHFYPQLLLIHVYTEPKKRYERLAKRKIRPYTEEEARARDIAEIEKLNKGGPIAIADYVIENNNDDLQVLYTKITTLLKRLGVTV